MAGRAPNNDPVLLYKLYLVVVMSRQYYYYIYYIYYYTIYTSIYWIYNRFVILLKINLKLILKAAVFHHIQSYCPTLNNILQYYFGYDTCFLGGTYFIYLFLYDSNFYRHYYYNYHLWACKKKSNRLISVCNTLLRERRKESQSLPCIEPLMTRNDNINNYFRH